MGRSQRQKGKRGEQEACKLLRRLFPNVRTKRAGGESASVDRGRDLLGTPGVCFQVKSMSRPNPLRALAEAEKAAKEDEMTVALTHKTGEGEWVATLPARHLLLLMVVAGMGERESDEAGQS